ncbi:MAG: RNA polymerase factor sigma-54, partial [Planctomycetota bacterium]
EVQELFEVLNTYESRYGGEEPPRRRVAEEVGSKHEAMLNHEDRPETWGDHLLQQLGFLELDSDLREACHDLAGSMDSRGYLLGELDEMAFKFGVAPQLAAEALTVIQGLEPCGVGARDLKECLLLQLGDVPEAALERRMVEEHLDDLLQNRLPKIAERLEVALADVKDSMEIISSLNPRPGSSFSVGETSPAVPEVFVDEIDGEFQVRMEEGNLPPLRISPQCSTLLREGGDNPRVVEFVRRKIESARWLIHAIEQRRRTLLDIAQTIVKYQEPFFREGPGHLQALTMQTVADAVKVHVSTVSRATNGKYIETPYGVMELRRFFTGGVEREDGSIESRDNVCQMIQEIVATEDNHKPLSDSQLAKQLQERGLEIARRTVTKYRERAGVPPARLRKKH